MISVTRLDGSRILLNDDLIESIQQTPDTMVSLVNHHKLLVRDTPNDLLARVIAFKQAVQHSSESGVHPTEAPSTTVAELVWPRRYP